MGAKPRAPVTSNHDGAFSLAAAADPRLAFREHFSAFVCNPLGTTLLDDLSQRVKSIAIANPAGAAASEISKTEVSRFFHPYRVPNQDCLVVTFAVRSGAKKDEWAQWWCAPGCDFDLDGFPPDYAKCLRTHNGIFFQSSVYSRLGAVQFLPLEKGERPEQFLPSSGQRWADVNDEFLPVIRGRCDDKWYLHPTIRTPAGACAISLLGHDSDRLQKPMRKDVSVGEAFLCFTGREIVLGGAGYENELYSWFPD